MFFKFIYLFLKMKLIVKLHLARKDFSFLNILFSIAFVKWLTFNVIVSFKERFIDHNNSNFLLAIFFIDYHGLLKSNYRSFINYYEKNHF